MKKDLEEAHKKTQAWVDKIPPVSSPPPPPPPASTSSASLITISDSDSDDERGHETEGGDETKASVSKESDTNYGVKPVTSSHSLTDAANGSDYIFS